MWEKHEREDRIWLDPVAHAYHVQTGEGKEAIYSTSVSGLVEAAFPRFDAKRTIERCYSAWSSNPTSRYFELIHDMKRRGLSDEECITEIGEGWKRKGEAASSRGTYVHEQIEAYLKGSEWDASYPEMDLFMKWHSDMKSTGWEMVRSEMCIFDEEAEVGACVDSLWRDRDGAFHMVDWKCCDPTPKRQSDGIQLLGPGMKAFNGECGIGPCSHIANTKFGHYVVQQNAYSYILEKHYNIKVSTMQLLQMHPTMASYHLVSVPDERAAISRLFLERVRSIRILSSNDLSTRASLLEAK